MKTVSQPTVTISKKLLATHMYSHAVAIGLLDKEKVAEIVSQRKAQLKNDVAERTIFLREPEDADAEDEAALFDALEERCWQGVQFGKALWAVEFDLAVDAVLFVLRFDRWVVKAT